MSLHYEFKSNGNSEANTKFEKPKSNAKTSPDPYQLYPKMSDIESNFK
jgi:hypothetical protein